MLEAGAGGVAVLVMGEPYRIGVEKDGTYPKMS